MKHAIAMGCAVLLAACCAAAGVGATYAAPNAPRTAAARALTGRCHCGAVAYEVRGAVVRCSYCDCRACQRASGTLKAPYVTVRRADFRITRGRPASFRSKAKDKCDCYGVWHFCRKCGGPLYWESDNGKELDVFAATFDDPKVFQPGE